VLLERPGDRAADIGRDLIFNRRNLFRLLARLGDVRFRGRALDLVGQPLDPDRPLGRRESRVRDRPCSSRTLPGQG